MPSTVSLRTFKYYDWIMASFVSVLLCANLIGPAKLWSFELFGQELIFGASIVFFPLSYLFGDVLTEVYGYARARRVVWAGLMAMVFASFMSQVMLALPPARSWEYQSTYEMVFGSTWRIALGSIVAYFFGEICNSFVLAKMKVWTEGRFLFARTIGSTVVGEAVDTVIFYTLAFAGVWTHSQLISVMIMSYCFKVLWEVLATPITYPFVAWLKSAESVDHYDRDTEFSPFKI